MMRSTFRAALRARVRLGVVRLGVGLGAVGLGVVGLGSVAVVGCATGNDDGTVSLEAGTTKADGAGDTGPCGTANAACCANNECNTGSFCNAGICKPQNPTDFGKACSVASDCMSGVCAPLDLDGGSFSGPSSTVCSTGCTTASQCPSGWSCPPPLAVGQASVCICTPQAEMCDGLDDNCDGKVDEEPAADEACTAQNGVPEKCVNGSCVCADSASECNGTCVDLTSDSANCGKCNVACDTPDQSCQNSKCACALTTCSGKCIDTMSDPKNCGGCGKTCPFACAAGACGPLQLAAGGGGGGDGIASDGTNVYFLGFDQNFELDLFKCAATGCTAGATTVTKNINPGAPAGGVGSFGSLLVIGGTNLFWPDGQNVQGTPVPVPATPPAPKTYYAGPSTSSPWQVATDATNVYWSDTGAGVIYKCALGTTCAHPTVVVNVLGAPAPTMDGGVPEAGLDASADGGFVTTAVPPQNVAVDSKYVYWTDENGSISSQLLTGGPINLIVDGTVSGSEFPPNMILAANGDVYWTLSSEFTSGGVFTCSATATLATCPNDGFDSPGNLYSPATTVSPFGLATDGKDLYWTDQGPPAAVYKCALGAKCATATVIVPLSSNALPSFITVDSTHAFWMDSTTGGVFEYTK